MGGPLPGVGCTTAAAVAAAGWVLSVLACPTPAACKVRHAVRAGQGGAHVRSSTPVAAVEAGGTLAAVVASSGVRGHVPPRGVAAAAAAVAVVVALRGPAGDVEGLATGVGCAGLGLRQEGRTDVEMVQA
jgi:hypothetical protein